MIIREEADYNDSNHVFSAFCVVCDNDVMWVLRENTITQQPAGSTGSHAYGHVADDRESQIRMILEYPRLIKKPKNINIKKSGKEDLIIQGILWSEIYCSLVGSLV
jgi:hypothetical protein